MLHQICLKTTLAGGKYAVQKLKVRKEFKVIEDSSKH